MIKRVRLMAELFLACLGTAAPVAAVSTTDTVASRTISATNPQSQEFPGGRNADELIIYTPEFGVRTGTNDYGVEAVVEDSVVVTCEGNDSKIPPNGYVVSGHGDATAWIIANLPPGTEVELTSATVIARQTTRSLEVLVTIYADAARSRIAQTSSTGGNAQAVESALAATSAALSAGRVHDATRSALAALGLAEPSPAAEGRGVWFRLNATTPEETVDLVERAHATGINMLFPETIYWSGTLCPVLRDGGPRQHVQYTGWDPLEVLVTEAHKRGMQVHAWCEIFFVGPGEPAIAEERPEWLAVDRRGGTRALAEQNFRFLCPSNPDAREWILANLEALASKYPVDGIHYDYIRYPVSEPYEDGFCYCSLCRSEFQKNSGHDPMNITPKGNPRQWAEWSRWREERITSLVREATRRLRAVRKGIIISAAIFPDVTGEARAKKMQDWPLWAEEGLLDLICPMAYFTESAAVAARIVETVDNAHGVPVFAGLAPFMGLTPAQLVRQVAVSREAGATGAVFFAEEHLQPDHRDALSSGPWRTRAAVPPLRPQE